MAPEKALPAEHLDPAWLYGCARLLYGCCAWNAEEFLGGARKPWILELVAGGAANGLLGGACLSVNPVLGEAEREKGGVLMAIFVILALLLGVACGQVFFSEETAGFISEKSEWVLMLLMFSVGISVGTNRELFQKLRRMDLRVWMVPVGVILGSLLGSALCGVLAPFGFLPTLSVGAGMGWYSLSGVMLSDFYGAEVGALAFLSNLLRELISFLTIPLAVRYLNPYAAIALAGATSEDTTLPILMRHSSAEMVVYSVINGVLTSAAVPVLLRMFYIS